MKKFNKVSIAVGVACALGLIVPITALAAGPATVNLGSAGNFVILTKTGITTTGSTVVVGDIGVSPIAATGITGFGLILPAAGAFSTSALVTGKVYASDYAAPTPANLTTAINNMQTAYTDAMGRAPTSAATTELGAGNIGGLTLSPGTYKWGTGLTIPTDVTLSGGANDVWIFQVAQTLTVSSGVKINLIGGAQASNIFWVVAKDTTIGTNAVFNGNILDQTGIALNTGARLNGRALAQTATTLQSNAVTMPTYTAPITPPASITPPATSTPPAASTPATYTPPLTVTNTSTNPNLGTTNSSSNNNVVYNPSAPIVYQGGQSMPVIGRTITVTNPVYTPNTTFTPASVPNLPNTGFPPKENSTPWNIVILAGALMLVSTSLVVFLRKSTI